MYAADGAYSCPDTAAYYIPQSRILSGTTEGFSATTSCYGAKPGECHTCRDVIKAYKQRGWDYKKPKARFEQCKGISDAEVANIVS